MTDDIKDEPIGDVDPESPDDDDFPDLPKNDPVPTDGTADEGDSE